MLTVPHCKESLSRAYITAVVGHARHNLLWGREYDYGVDGSVRILEKRGHRIREIGLGFDFQSKTTVDWSIDDNHVVYDLDAEACNDLVERAGTGALPFLLILLCLHSDDSTWLHVDVDKLILQKCAHWIQLDGVLTRNSDSKRIHIPLANVLTPKALSDILRDIKDGKMVP